MRGGYVRVKRTGVAWARQYMSIEDGRLVHREREGANATHSSSLGGSIVRPLGSEAHGFVLVVKGEAPTQISCGGEEEKAAWVKAIKIAAAAANSSAKSPAPLSRRPPQGVGLRPKKKEPLREAIQRQDVDAVEQLLRDGASVNATLGDGSPPLCAAVAQARGGLDVAAALLDAGADIHGRDLYGATALMKAARLGNEDLLDLLLQIVEANDPELLSEVIDILDYKQNSALSLCSKQGHAACAEMLLDNGASVDLVVADGNTALLVAAAAGHVEIVRKLLNAGASTTVKDIEEETALMKAAAEGHDPVVSALIEHDPRSIGQHNREHFTALHYAASVGHLRVVEAMLDKGADARAADTEGRTALVLAAMFGHASIVTLLHGSLGGPDMKTPVTKDEERLGLAAAQHEGHEEVVRVLQQAVDERRARDAPVMAAEVQKAMPEVAAETLEAHAQLSRKLEASVGAMASATDGLESRVSQLETLLDKVEKTSGVQQRSNQSERAEIQKSVLTLEERVDILEELVDKQSESRVETRLARLEQKVTDLTVQLTLRQKRGGGAQDNELEEKFEWLRAQQEQMLLVMSEAIQRQVLAPQPDDSGAVAAATTQAQRKARKLRKVTPPAVQKRKEANAATKIQSVHRGRRARQQQKDEAAAASAIQKQYRTHLQRQFFQSRLTMEEDWAASHIQSAWRTRQQRLFFANRESVERGYATPAKKTPRGTGKGKAKGSGKGTRWR